MNMEEEDILTQDEDLIYEEMKKEEMKKDKEVEKVANPKEKAIETVTTPHQGVEETFEAFMQEERMGIVNTLTGEVIDGFDPKKDAGLIKLGKAILNQLNKISITSGAQ